MAARKRSDYSGKHQRRSESASDGIKLIQAGVCFLLCALIAALGTLSYQQLTTEEINIFKSTFASVSLSVTENVTSGLLRKTQAAALVGNIYSHAIQNKYGGTLPNFTLPGYESIMKNLCDLSGLRLVSFSPLVTNTTRKQFEAYARENVGLLNGPISLNVSTGGSWVVADGISNATSKGFKKSSGYIPGSLYPTMLFPVWQTAPIAETSRAVMVDVHGVVGSRVKAVDQLIKTKAVAFTEIVRLVADGAHVRPSTLLYTPILSSDSTKSVIGLISGGFSWDDVLKGIVPNKYQIECVVITKTHSFTYSLQGSEAVLMGEGDLHDTTHEKYSVSFAPLDNTDYVITIYPSKNLYNMFITNTPKNICITVVLLITFTAFLVLVYGHLVKKRENKLTEIAKHSFAGAAARDAVLHAKKVYVRYISHEIRTPLNAAYLGLKILEKEISKTKGPFHIERLATIRDVVNACDIAVGILNDLLNYDKLEDGTLMVEPRKMVALPFIISSTNLFLLQAEEKGVQVIFDVAESILSEKYPTNFDASHRFNFLMDQHNFLSCDDCIDVDEHKMSQVIRNLVSNAIKFTPEGNSVTIKLRKLPPKGRTVTLPSPQSREPDKNWRIFNRTSTFRSTLPSPYPAPYLPPLDGVYRGGDVETGFFSSCYNRGNPTPTHRGQVTEDNNTTMRYVDYGTLVLDVIDSGVGMAPEDSKRLFKEIIQFNPSELQAGGGSGLGMMITKALVDLHGGKVSVYSAGVGKGCIFTLKIPLTAPCDPSLSSFIPEPVDIDVVSEDFGILLRSIEEMKLSHPRAEASSPNSYTTMGQYAEERETDLGQGPGLGLRTPPVGTLDPIQCNVTGTTFSLSPEVPYTNVSKYSELAPTQMSQKPLPANRKKGKFNDETIPEFISSCVKRLNILVVDDSKLNRRMLIKLLLTDDHVCDEAEDGVIAVAKVSKRLLTERENMRDKSTNPNESLTSAASFSVLEGEVPSSVGDVFSKKKDIWDVKLLGPRSLSSPARLNVALDAVYDAILMDFMMPNMDGPTATEAIRRLGYKGLILGVTGNALPSDIEHFMSHGANQVLLKPVNIEALEAALYHCPCVRDVGIS